MAFAFYFDGKYFLELHALHAPVGYYKREITDDEYNARVSFAIQDFEAEHDIELYQLGRSGRHICIEDTPRNRRRYASLQRKAIDAAKALWADMREVS